MGQILKFMKQRFAGGILFAALTACDAYACWADIPLEEVIKGNPVVVVGEIQRVARAPKSKYDYDTAFIRVERVLKSLEAKDKVKVGGEIPLLMPSINNESRMSCELRYEKGQRGVWILKIRDGKYWAGYPKD